MFAETLETLLQSKGISKKQFLADLGLGKNSFVNWAARGNLPNGETLQRISEYLAVSVDELLDRPIPTVALSPEKQAQINRIIALDLEDAALDELVRYAVYLSQRKD